MARRFTEPRLILASHNVGKLREIVALIAPFGIETRGAAELDLPEPEETGLTFTENAVLKARAAATATGAPALADDSGLVVAGLDGAPGLHSARWAETSQGRDFVAAMNRVEFELGADGDRRAHFISVLALYWPDGHCEIFEGRIDGHLTFPPLGARGFGYDPIFVPGGYDVTFGEMDPDEHYSMSHRARAFSKLVAACFEAP